MLREQLVREKIETGAEVQTVLATDVIFSSAGVSGGGESASLRATANLRVLYLDENAVPLLSERRSEVLLETDLPGSGPGAGCRTCTRARSPRPSARTAWSALPRNVCRQRGGNAALSLSSVA